MSQCINAHDPPRHQHTCTTPPKKKNQETFGPPNKQFNYLQITSLISKISPQSTGTQKRQKKKKGTLIVDDQQLTNARNPLICDAAS